MKTCVLATLSVLVIAACSIQKQNKSNTQIQEIVVDNSDSIEYELVVFDAKFETFLVTQPYPKSYYSDQYYQNWNNRYCVEWNSRNANPLRYGDFYETQIPYDTTVDYGLDFNFKLYQYFQFIEKEYGIVLVNRRGP